MGVGIGKVKIAYNYIGIPQLLSYFTQSRCNVWRYKIKAGVKFRQFPTFKKSSLWNDSHPIVT